MIVIRYTMYIRDCYIQCFRKHTMFIVGFNCTVYSNVKQPIQMHMLLLTINK